MDIKEAAHTPAAAQAAAAPSGAALFGVDGSDTARRRLLAAGLAGVAVSLVPWLSTRASASSPPTTDTDEATETSGADDAEPTEATAETIAVTTTTAPPKQPTEADIVLLDFAQTVELTIRNLYDVAITGGVFDGSSVDDINAIREAHEGYGTAIAGVIGRRASNTPNIVLFDELQSSFGGEASAVAKAAAALENTAVATHLDILGQLVGVDGASLIASIAIVEARHATLLKVLAGATDLADQLATDGEALSPSDYTVE